MRAAIADARSSKSRKLHKDAEGPHSYHHYPQKKHAASERSTLSSRAKEREVAA